MEPSIGRYRIEAEIGRGAMGVVYRAHDPFLDRHVALKVMRDHGPRDPHRAALYESLFYNETRAAGLLSHPGIVAVHDAGRESGHYYIAMELVEGATSLDRHVEASARLPLEGVAEIVFQCAEALDYAHRKGVIHRDIKPANVLVDPHRAVYLADFSVALLTDPSLDETQLLVPAGSPLYMSPEQIEGGPITPRSDLFSLGVLLYELVTGHRPFEGDSVAAVTHRVVHVRPESPLHHRPGLPPALVELIERCLAKDPAARPADAFEVASELGRIFGRGHRPLDGIATEGRVGSLRRLEFFAPFREAEIWELLRWAHWEEHPAGAAVLEEGGEGDSLYILVEGTVRVEKAGALVTRLHQGECFGEIGYLTHQRRTATVRCESPAVVLRMNARVLDQASERCQLQFQRVFIRVLIERLVQTTRDLGALGARRSSGEG